MFCDKDVMKQEGHYLSLLSGTITYRFQRSGMLELHGGNRGWTIIGRYYKKENLDLETEETVSSADESVDYAELYEMSMGSGNNAVG